MLSVKQTAPDFNVVDQNNAAVKLSDYHAKNNLVLYFYPKDDTSGCTLEAKQFTALAAEFAAADTVILGVSKDDCASHQAFIAKYNLNVMLLADEQGELCEAYQVWQEKEKNGIKKMGIVRSTFIIDKTGVLRFVEYGVTANGHADMILEHVQQL
jgi:peroxiredoxin